MANVTSHRVSIKQAALELGIDECEVRYRMRTGEIDLGIVLKPKRKGGCYGYRVFRAKLDKVLGIERSFENEKEEE